MRTSLLLTAALAGLAIAEDTTTVGYFAADWTSIEIPRYESTAASVAGINAVATTYAVGCLKDAPTSLCHIDKPWTLIQGSETYSLTGVYTAGQTGKEKDNGVTVTRDIQCSFTSFSESAGCSFSYQATGKISGASYSTGTSSSSTFATDQVGYYKMPVTAGLSSFTAPQATETPDAARAVGPARALITAAPLAAAAAVAIF
ncbi:hypothetical protein P170DRAFT_440325 [Aspergillus steynii IBT 23096]|uniref:GPI anchored cell wall protein n=1 Tax=Aspergillus steynii IBT 23096 TaxID=1392250 RepID=A0A2I2FX25_9EURO|nr:uncharacterized protein P170DRAFT_440325 [Aspergillus steynii IBT 23096]PLB45188.1 hypothetical protein P170DRAFT_440325 [Aspergillus steynii IBT 23096]